ncbi:MAG: MFS transporter [Actinomycetota bacterium]
MTTAAAADTSPTDLSPRHRLWVLVTMCLALVAVVASVSGLNVGLNELAVEFDASTSTLLWVVNAYTLVMAALLLPVGEIGDRIGRSRMLTFGLIVFAAANGAAILADSVGQLIATRAIGGIGAAMIMPATLSTLTSVFPAEERGRAVGIWSGFAGAGGVLGLFASAVLIDVASWEWLFVLPVASAALALVLNVALVPNTRSTDTHRLDIVGGVLSALAVGGVVLGIHEGPELGWTHPVTLIGLIGGAVALAAFVRWELRHPHPLLDLRIFTNRSLAAGAGSLLVLFALLFGVFLALMQFLQAVLGLSALAAASGLLPMAVVMLGLSPFAPGLAERFGLSRLLTGGALLMGAGFFGMALVGDSPSYLDVVPSLILIGTGLGFAMSPATTAITESLPADKQGVASALNDTVREAGSSIGVALLGSVLAAGYRSGIADTAETLPEEIAHPVEEGIGQAMAVAAELGPDGAEIATAAEQAFLDGWSTSMIVAAVLAVAAGIGVQALFRIRPDESEAVEEELETALAA